MIGIVVKGCRSEFGDNCPMFDEDDEIGADRCMHPVASMFDQACQTEGAGGEDAPCWCPLRDNEFTIALVAK
jgi:hypothetical protein